MGCVDDGPAGSCGVCGDVVTPIDRLVAASPSIPPPPNGAGVVIERLNVVIGEMADRYEIDMADRRTVELVLFGSLCTQVAVMTMPISDIEAGVGLVQAALVERLR